MSNKIFKKALYSVTIVIITTSISGCLARENDDPIDEIVSEIPVGVDVPASELTPNQNQVKKPDFIASQERDSDGDGLPDSKELQLGTDSTNADSDNDGLTDYREVLIGTNPMNADTDGDSFLDGAEYRAGYDPLIPQGDKKSLPTIIQLP